MLRLSLILVIVLAFVDRLGARAPDIILMMADDMGFSDLGCYGSEIPTPNLDRLANHGIRFTQFYNTSRCCPSRASLLTGRYSHQVGVGDMNHAGVGPGYQGQLDASTPTIAERLRMAGYSTTMVGKWHLTMSNTIDDGPNGSWPLQRGFEKFFGSMEGAKNYFRTKWLFDQREEVSRFPSDFFYTDAITRRTASHIRHQPADKPIFCYVAFYAPHFPLQAPRETIARFRGTYTRGWDAVRKQRFEKQKRLGLVPAVTKLSPRPQHVPAWTDLDELTRDEMDLRMAIYAAQVHRLDQGVGRILDALEDSGRLESALVMFLSDNGGTNSGGPTGSGRVDLLGTPNAELNSTYGEGWANVSNTPYREFKANTHEGGTRAPLIMHWPDRFDFPSRIDRRPSHIIDIAATILDASAYKPTNYPETHPLEGISLLPSDDGAESNRPRTIFFEHRGSRAVRSGDWKLVNRSKQGPWELYDLATDPTELDDVAKQMPEHVEELSKLWQVWAERCHVLKPATKTERKSGDRGTPVRPLSGTVIDDVSAIKSGRWQSGNRLDGYYGDGYLYSSNSDAVIEYLLHIPDERKYELRLLYSAHPNRGHSVPVTVTQGLESTKRLVNMQLPPTAGYYKSLGIVTSKKGKRLQIRLETKEAGGVVHADAIQLIMVDEE